MLGVMLLVSLMFMMLTTALVTVNGRPADLHEARKNYFREEYTLDYYLSTYDKPIIAVMDGITSAYRLLSWLMYSGWRSWIEYQCTVSCSYGKDFVCYARDVDWLLSRRWSNIFPPSSGRRVGRLPRSNRSPIKGL